MHQQPLTRARVYRDFLGACRGSLTAPAPGLPATGQPSGRTLTCKGSEPADGAASSGSLHHPRRLAPPGGPGRRKRLGVRRAPAREARSEPGRVATLTSPSTVTSLRNPVRARGGAARARPARGGVEELRRPRGAPRGNTPPTARPPRRGRSKFTATVAGFLLLVPSQTSRESLKEGGSANPTGGLKKYQRLWGWAHFGSTAETLHTIGRYSC